MDSGTMTAKKQLFKEAALNGVQNRTYQSCKIFDRLSVEIGKRFKDLALDPFIRYYYFLSILVTHK